MSYFPLPLARAVTVISRFAYNGEHLNRFSYVASADITTVSQLESFLAAFKTTVLAPIRNLQVDALVWLSHYVSVKQPGSPYLENFDPQGGAVTMVQGMPPHITYTFRLLRSVTGVRGGFKRFSGVPESYTEFGAYSIGTPPAGDVTAARNALVATISAGGVDYQPAVFIETFNGQPLPVLHYYAPTGCEFRQRPGTQNTRKP